MQDFRKIKVWHEARAFTVTIYKATAGFPPEERYGLTDQVRRSAKAIGAAIVEGFGKSTRADCARCLTTSMSEASETSHHLITAFDLGLLSQAEFDALELQLTPLRRRLGALYFRIRPAGNSRRKPKSRGKSGPKAGKSGRNAGQSGPKAG